MTRRVLHIVGAMNMGGAESMLMNWYRHLDRDRWQFDFLYFTESSCIFDSEILELGGRIHRAPGSRFKHLFALTRILREDPNIVAVHCHTGLSGSYYLAVPKVMKVSIFAHAQSSDSGKPPSPLNRLYERTAIRAISVLNPVRLACSLQAGRYLFPDSPPDAVTLVRNAIEVEVFSGQRVVDNEIERLWQSTPGLRILQVGRLEKVKNHDKTLEALQSLRMRGIPFKAVILGSGTRGFEIRERIAAEGLDKFVLLREFVEDMPSVMRSADVLVMPSLFEGVPVTLIEAQAVGLPAVVSDSVSPECDLGLGLITFLPVNAPSREWASHLMTMGSTRGPLVNERTKALASAGYDIRESTRKLVGLYQSQVTGRR